MDYTYLYFGKSLEDLNIDDIENFFREEKEESDKIEFKAYYSDSEKSFKDKQGAILKTICGLLNSEGGILIWGAPIGKLIEGKKEKVFTGNLSPVEKLIEKDSFINKVTDSITPSPEKIKFKSLEFENGFVYIIEVAKSTYSPHQFKNIYFMRIDGQTKPAPHHYIEALFRKIEYPKIEGFLRIDKFSSDRQNEFLDISVFILNQSKLQNEHDLYYRVFTTIGQFSNFGKYVGNDRSYTANGHELICTNSKSTLYYAEPYSDSETIVISPQDLDRANYIMKILLYFGGKSSPLRISEYTLSFNDFSSSNPNSLIVELNENQYAHEKSDDSELTYKEKLNKLLNR
jgi:hypothetical protein